MGIKLREKHMNALRYRKGAIQVAKVVEYLQLAEGLLLLVQTYRSLCGYFF